MAGAKGAFSTGISGGYSKTVFRDRVSASAAAGLYTIDAGEFDSTVASILFGLRYSF